ncbi:MAG TPA: hypothetical protein VEU94_12955 [Terriglobales bacterium]|nr:hypothetical protein [Terriglobales bacterium]
MSVHIAVLCPEWAAAIYSEDRIVAAAGWGDDSFLDADETASGCGNELESQRVNIEERESTSEES